MDPHRWQEIQATFDTIVEMDDVERGNRLTELSTSDPELRAAVELLLAADSGADARLASLEAVFFPQSAPASDPLGLAGRTVSHFQIHEPIGAGGMGVVYRAEDARLGRAVALKFLLPSHSLDAGAKARFLREARLVAALDHPNLCTIHEVGTSDDGRIFLAMALYPGETLKVRLTRDGPMPVSEILDIATQVIEGLECAHGAGIVHRDLKPGNVMLLPDGTVKILDFGLAKARDQSLSEPGARFGTVSYMSPEQIRGETANERGDLWALGVVLYEMLTQRKPFGGEQDIAIAHAILHDAPVPLSKQRGDLSAALDDLVLRLLQKDPAKRYATASELLGELARIDTAGKGTIGSLRTRRRRALRNADRDANAGDFARALATPRVPQRPSARSRRWVPIAIGGAVATVAAIAFALSLARNSGSPPLPDRVQLTFTGNAIAPSLSPDGTRLAFAEKECDPAGSCTYQLVIQDTDGTGRLVVARNIGYIYETQWISDGRFLEFAGSYPPSRHGTFAVSTLGGEPRYLGCCAFDLLSGDTAFLSAGHLPGVDRHWVRRITVHDGQTLDSVPVRDQGATYHTIALSVADRLIVAVRKTFESAPELRLTDFRGQVINRITPPFWSLDRFYFSRWVPSRQKLVIASQREVGGTAFDILTMKVTASGIEPDIDTVFSGLQFAIGMFDVSPDGERLVYSAGPVETSLSTIDVDRTPPRRLAATQVLSSTTLLRGRISPAGDKIFLARDAPRAGGHASQFSLIPRNGGAESQIPGAVENLLDFQWSPDGARIMYLHGIGGNKIRLVETDTTGRGTREIARLEQSAAIQFHPLPDGAVWIMSPDRRSLSVIRRPGKRDVTWHIPEWISGIGSISPSPDAKSLAVQAVNRSFHSVVVATVDIESGRFTRIGIFAGSDPQKITWLEDGSIMFVLREPQGAWVLYRKAPGRPAERLGTLPHSRADFSVSNDGRQVAVFSYSDKNDIYMIRNFGKMLQR
ncbi:MAG: serine/threonine-protein kinase [Gemmatimonadaceae bacterium]|nr:serine/threonine-protein kinase [Gemmatimonadaceae bacterium]